MDITTLLFSSIKNRKITSRFGLPCLGLIILVLIAIGSPACDLVLPTVNCKLDKWINKL